MALTLEQGPLEQQGSLEQQGECDIAAIEFEQEGVLDLADYDNVEVLRAKLEMSAQLGRELLDREDSYRRELELMQQKLWNTSDELTSLRSTNAGLVEEVFALRKENVRMSLASEDTVDKARQQQHVTSEQTGLMRMHEIEQELQTLRASKYEMQEKATELKIELEACTRINKELQSRQDMLTHIGVLWHRSIHNAQFCSPFSHFGDVL
jgi:hypothetical protein